MKTGSSNAESFANVVTYNTNGRGGHKVGASMGHSHISWVLPIIALLVMVAAWAVIIH
jgi:hypothetical protein